VNRFIIDPARAYRYFSTVAGFFDYYRRLIKACLLDAQALLSDNLQTGRNAG
jgi:hypothetical protein